MTVIFQGDRLPVRRYERKCVENRQSLVIYFEYYLREDDMTRHQ
jgi:hypothetical protein